MAISRSNRFSSIRLPRLALGLAVVGCWLLSGCQLSDWARNGFMLGPNHEEPVSEISADWIDSNDERVLSEPLQFPDWWVILNDSKVNLLVDLAYQQNLTLRQAGTRVLQARAQRAIAEGNIFPQVQQAFGDYVRLQESENIALPAPLRNFDQWERGFNLSWELDVWGRFRRAIESADASLDASIREYDAILISLIAEVVTAYTDIRTFEQRLDNARENVKIQQSSLELATTRFNEGKTSEIGVFLAKSNLNATEATIPSLETGLRQASNRLCTLLGIPPTSLKELLGNDSAIPIVPNEVSVGIPADLLRRRPDVREAERLVAAQSAVIGIALADLYPTISITGEIFLASEKLNNLFDSGSTAASVGPSFRWNILNYGRIVNNVELQDARLLELIANYQNTVLSANQEVEDALVAFLKSQEEVEKLKANVDNLQKSLDLLLINFQEGSIDFSPVFLLQGTLRAAQDRLSEAQGRVVVNLIDVYRALGGGWQIRCPDFVPNGSVAVEEPVSDKPGETSRAVIERLR